MNGLSVHKILSQFKFFGRVATVLTIMAALALSASDASAQRREKLYNRLYADQKPIHLGFSIGMHVADLKFTHNGYVAPDGEQWYAEVPAWSPGFCVNVLADLRLHKYFNLRLSPGMYFGSKTAHFREFGSGALERQDVKTACVVVPLDLKISGDRLGNTRPYVTLGAMGSFDVSKKRSDFLWINAGDAYLTCGLGCDFYLPFFKLNPEIKFCFGLTDVLKHDRPDLEEDPQTFKVTQSLKKVKSNMVVINFYFE